jgi:CheY-like chemotaxis protein
LLVIEDSDDDYAVLERLLARAGFDRPRQRFARGEDALAHLRRSKADPADLPGVVLLDLNLPDCNGRQVLEQLKGDPILRRIPVVVLTTSASESDVLGCYDAGANGYVQKAVDLSRFEQAVRSLITHWFEVVLLPRAHFPG